MADIFISYAKAHAQLTKDLAHDLEVEGYTTWWDTSLLPGDEFPEEINREIDAAQAVIVIWTETSVRSKWVNAEANRAHQLGKLITLHDEGLDLECLPLPFNTLQSSVVTDRVKVFAALARRRIRPTGDAAANHTHKIQTAPAPNSDKAQVPQASNGQLATAAREEWKQLKSEDNVGRLKLFANHFAGSYYAELAKERIEEIAAGRWQFDIERGIKLKIESPFARTPHAGLVQERKEQIEKLKLFVSEFAGTRHAGLAQERIEKLTNEIEEAERKKLEEARLEETERPENEAWYSVLAKRDPELTVKFLEQFPNGKYAEEAKKRIDMIKKQNKHEAISLWLGVLGFISLVAIPTLVWMYLWTHSLLLRVFVSIIGTILVLIFLFCILLFNNDTEDALVRQERKYFGKTYCDS